jgi:hypothetical protein
MAGFAPGFFWILPIPKINNKCSVSVKEYKKRRWCVREMAKRTKKNDPQQKNKKGFDSSRLNQEFAHEIGSAATNKIHKDKAKKEKTPKNNGEYKD